MPFGFLWTRTKGRMILDSIRTRMGPQRVDLRQKHPENNLRQKHPEVFVK